jgi:ActR/RegA family two-component response regulator
MTMPFDTLKLARRLEAAGFPAQQAGDMSEGIAEAVAQLATKADIALLKNDITALATATKADLASLEQRLIIRLGGLMTLATGVLVAIKYFG